MHINCSELFQSSPAHVGPDPVCLFLINSHVTRDAGRGIGGTFFSVCGIQNYCLNWPSVTSLSCP